MSFILTVRLTFFDVDHLGFGVPVLHVLRLNLILNALNFYRHLLLVHHSLGRLVMVLVYQLVLVSKLGLDYIFIFINYILFFNCSEVLTVINWAPCL